MRRTPQEQTQVVTPYTGVLAVWTQHVSLCTAACILSGKFSVVYRKGREFKFDELCALLGY